MLAHLDAQHTPDLWVVTADTLVTLLPLWDAWCPDDGRPAAALATARDHLQHPTSISRIALTSALAAVQAAQAMACAVSLTLENWVTISLAWTTAAAIALFLSALLAPDPQVAHRWRDEAAAQGQTLQEQRRRLLGGNTLPGNQRVTTQPGSTSE